MTPESINLALTRRALSFLPVSIAKALENYISLSHDAIDEIRLRTGSFVFLRCSDRNVNTGIFCRQSDVDSTVRNLCGNSVYSHSESMKEGFISAGCGIRAGIAGRAVYDGGRMMGIADITSVAIRIPKRYPKAADELKKLLKTFDWRCSVLIFSPPAGGKTTVLRELCAAIGQMPSPKKVAVVDSRSEICGGLEGLPIDILEGFSRSKGMEIALRTLSPELIVCDEISTEDDVRAAIECKGAGVPIVATVHADEKDLFSREAVVKLRDAGVFDIFYGIKKHNGSFVTTVIEAEECDHA